MSDPKQDFTLSQGERTGQSIESCLDDVFGPEDVEHHAQDVFDDTVAHPSDMNRLQTEHSTAGYREGVNTAKEKSIQAGFDEGFSLGASIGLQAGQLLGTLEGIAEALKSRNDVTAAESDSLLTQAKADLTTTNIFSPDYWEHDGNWKFQVKTTNDGGEIVFSDVADAHPLVEKWQKIVDEQVAKWGIDRSIIEQETGPRLENVPEPIVRLEAASTLNKGLEW